MSSSTIHLELTEIEWNHLFTSIQGSLQRLDEVKSVFPKEYNAYRALRTKLMEAACKQAKEDEPMIEVITDDKIIKLKNANTYGIEIKPKEEEEEEISISYCPLRDRHETNPTS